MIYGIFNLDTGEWLVDDAGRALHSTNRLLMQVGAALAGPMLRAAFVSRSLPAEQGMQFVEIATLEQLRLELETLRPASLVEFHQTRRV